METTDLKIEVAAGRTVVFLAPGVRGALKGTAILVGFWSLLIAPLYFVRPTALPLLVGLAAAGALARYYQLSRRKDEVVLGPDVVRMRSTWAFARVTEREVPTSRVRSVVHSRDLLGVSTIALDVGSEDTLCHVLGLYVSRSQQAEIVSAIAEALDVPSRRISQRELRDC